MFFGIQALIGFALDKYYYKDKFTTTKYIGIFILMVGIIYSIYGYHLQHKKVKNAEEDEEDKKKGKNNLFRFFFYN